MPAPLAALARSADIDRTYRRGALLRGAFFHVRALRARGTEHRLVVITPKKIFRDAVDRNRMARRTKALAPALKPATSYHIIVLPRAEALHTLPEALREDLAALFSQLA
jgi:ribonuclease P protein component